MYGRKKNEASKDSNPKYKDESIQENFKGNERRETEKNVVVFGGHGVKRVCV